MICCFNARFRPGQDYDASAVEDSSPSPGVRLFSSVTGVWLVNIEDCI